ncbi:MAG: HAMP domain-containing sensor histidine kinase [bacterium]
MIRLCDPVTGSSTIAASRGEVTSADPDRRLQFPLLADGGVVGTLELTPERLGGLSTQTTARIQNLANLFALSIAHERACMEARKQAEELERTAAGHSAELERQIRRRAVLLEIDLAVNQPHALQPMLDRIVDVTTRHLPSSGGSSIVLWNSQEQSFFVSSSNVDGQPRETASQRVRREGGATRWIVDHRQALLVPDIREDPFQANRMLPDYGLQAYAGVPLLAEGEVLGVLYALERQVRKYDTDDLEFLSALASRAALAITKVRVYESLRETNTLLEQRSRELVSVNQELKDFAHVVSHDLKAPLHAVGTLAGWIAKDYSSQIADEGKHLLEVLTARIHRMRNLIDGILNYSSVGRSHEARVEINLKELLTEIIDSLSPPAHVTIQISGQMPVLVLEKTRIHQVFQNLLSNAIKYIDKPKGEITVDCRDNDEFWEFSVADNGPGISEENREKVFELFRTFAPPSSNSGAGIGLAVVRKILELYGGRIWVESAEGEGSKFVFTLPKKIEG